MRIIAATNQDLGEMVEAGRFREDLYFRLNVFQISLPSLQQRKEDLPELIEHFISKESLKMGFDKAVQIQPEATQCLLKYSWPGNVRELQNVVARSLILAEDGVIKLSDLPQHVRAVEYPVGPAPGNSSTTLKQQLRHYEQAIILDAIAEADGDRRAAADRLGIGVSSLYRKLDPKSGDEA